MGLMSRAASKLDFKSTEAEFSAFLQIITSRLFTRETAPTGESHEQKTVSP
jgi:hypothetical protein